MMMKFVKGTAAVLAAALLAVGMTACSSPAQQPQDNQPSPGVSNPGNPDSGKEQKPEAPEDVTITLPASFFEEEQFEESITELQNSGATNVVRNDDGSVTLTMSAGDHEKMMTGVRDELNSSFTEIGEQFKSIKNVEFNDDFTHATMTVDREAFEGGMDSMSLMLFAIAPPLYQIYNGVPADQVKIEVEIKDEATGEVFQTQTYPEKQEG